MIYVIKCVQRRNAQIVSLPKLCVQIWHCVSTDPSTDGAQLSVDDFSHMMKYDQVNKAKRANDLKERYGWGEVLGGKH